MSSYGEEFATALTELQQVAATLTQGAEFFETQIKQGQPVAGYVQSCSAGGTRCQ